MLTLSREWMLERMLAADASYDGQFITGVVSTGIYCLPSCKARKPRPENVVFYGDPVQAREAGLRACRRCQPDVFYAGTLAEEALIDRLNALPVASLASVREVAQAAGLSERRLSDVFRTQLQCSPAEWLTRRRVLAAQLELLNSERQVADIAYSVGFESLSAFGTQFRRFTRLTPQAFRGLVGSRTFTLSLPADYRADVLLTDLARDPHGTTTQVKGQGVWLALRLPSGPQVVQVNLSGREAGIELTQPCATVDALELHTQLLRVLGLTREISKFERLLPLQPHVLPEHLNGVRVPLTPTPWDALLWAVVGQQVTFRFASTLRRRLAECCSESLGNGLYAPPSPAEILALSAAELRSLGLTGARAELLRRVARLALEGLTHEPQFTPVPRLTRTLMSIPGIGTWTTNYVLLRGYGLPDALPLGDSALATALQRLHHLPARPDTRDTERLMQPFAPYRSDATFRLWQTLNTPAHTP